MKDNSRGHGCAVGLREHDPPLACAPHNATGVRRYASQAARFLPIFALVNHISGLKRTASDVIVGQSKAENNLHLYRS